MNVLVLALTLSAQQQPTTIPEMWGAWCARCHAQDGSGKIDEPTVTVEPMDFTDCQVTSPEPDADWERAIAKGGPGVGLSPQMPAFEDSLTEVQIAGFVSHIRGFCTETGWPGGNVNFPRPIVTGKAFPENELVIAPAIGHDREYRIAAIYERRLGRRSMIEFELPLEQDGVNEVAISFKHALHSNDASILSLGLETAILKDTAIAELNGENRELSLTPQVRKGLTGTGALAASVGAMVPINEREERGVRWVGYLLWEYLEPWRARR